MEEFIRKIIEEAGRVLMTYYYGRAEVAYAKQDTYNIVTQADLASEKIIIQAIRERYPGHGIVSEESPPTQVEAEYVWYIDPLDGTANFARGLPFFGINVGVARRGEVVCGAIFLPALDELYTAEAGKGAFLNGKKIAGSPKKDWINSFGLVPTLRGTEEERAFLSEISRLSGGKAVMLCLGSPALTTTYVASGKRDWGWSRGGGPWDHAAGSVILREAQCRVTDFGGQPWSIEHSRGLVAAPEFFHPQLLEVVQKSLEK